MDINQLVEKFMDKPYLLDMGANKIAYQLKSDEQSVREAKKIYYNKIKYGTEYNPKDVAFKNNKSNAKVLMIDIETSPILTWTFTTRKAFIQPEQIERDWTILTFAAKWLGEDEIIFGTAKEEEEYDDFELVSKIWELLDQSDIIVAHNLNRFDKLKINARFLYHGLPPCSPFKSVDTYQIAKQNFGTTYHKLDFLSKYIGSTGKMEHEGFNLWKKCMHGDSDAWDMMLSYNKKDTIELEEVYLAIRAFDSRHPSMSIYKEEPGMCCTKCGSENINYVKDTYTNTRVFKLYQCSDCNGWSRSRSSEGKIKALMTQ